MRAMAILTAALLVAGCGDTDVAARGGEPAAEQDVEDGGLELDVEPVDIESTRWFQEGGVVEFNGRQWIIRGEPVFDPAVERVGEFEGTPLYAEVGVAPPYNELFVPVENDYWQMLEEASPAEATTGAGSEIPQGAPGVEPAGDPTGSGG